MAFMETVLLQRLHFLGISIFMFLSVFVIAWKLGYFKTSFQYFRGPQLVNFGDVVVAFIIFLTFQIIIMPIAAWIGLSIKAGHFYEEKEALMMDRLTEGWLNLIFISVSFLVVLAYLLLQPSQKKNWIIWDGGTHTFNRALKDFSLGILTWPISYPPVIFVSQVIGLIAYFLEPRIPVDQVAVKFLKTAYGDPYLFYSTAFVIIFLVPLTEEILFRGFLQRWLVGRVGKFFGIGITALVFALFHFSPAQQWENIELILSLFIFAIFLGYLYERQGSLWAPWGLHLFFNATSVIFIILGEMNK